MPDVFLGLGANLGDPGESLKEALRRLTPAVTLERVSSVYLTDPVGLREQPRFLNAVVRGRTSLSPRELLEFMEGVERAMGRQRDIVFGPRTIDLDLLLFGDVTCAAPDLTLPHPRMAERRFVLIPLAEIAPHTRLVPGGPTVVELLAHLPDTDGVELVELAGWPPPND